MKTKGFQGKIRKSAKVYTNDPSHKLEVIDITAFVRTPIHLSAEYVYLKGVAGETITKTIEIRAERDQPLKLEPAHFDLNSKVTYRIEEVETGKAFVIHFTSIPGPAETYQGFLKLSTNYEEKPEISVRVRGRFTSQKPPAPSKTPDKGSHLPP